MSEIGERVRLLLAQRGRSARELSLSIGASKNYVQSIIDGKSQNPSGAHLEALARELGTTWQFILKGVVVEAAEERDGLAIALSEPWWAPGPLPSPDEAGSLADEARSIRNRLGSRGSLDAVYWRAWLKKRLGQIRRGVKTSDSSVVSDRGSSAADELGPGTKSRPKRKK